MVELNTKEIADRINVLFEKGNPFVFWYDEKGNFGDNLNDIADQVKSRLLIMQANEQFKTKLELIEAEKNEQQVLIYSPDAKPNLSVNFMADMLRYSTEYTADASVILREELGLAAGQQEFVNQNTKFFASKERIKRFTKLINENPEVINLEAVIIAVLANSNSMSGIDILKAVLMNDLEDNSILNEFEKYGVEDSFWELMAQQYGYSSDEPRLIELISGLFMVYAYDKMEKDLPSNLMIYSNFKASTAVSIISNFLNMSDMSSRMKVIANEVWNFVGASAIFSKYSALELLNVDNFEQIDQAILKWIGERLLDGDYVPSGLNLNDITHKRQKMFFKDSYTSAYKMLRKALLVLSSHQIQVADNLSTAIYNYVGNSKNINLDRTNTAAWQVDTAYRKFIYYKRDLPLEMQSVFEDLATKVEQIYLNEYLDPIIQQWTKLFSYEQLNGQELQKNFYNNKIENSNERSVVIISDAFRFEAAKELQKKIELNENQYSSEMEYMITGVPSVTYFGMPSLLPHTSIEYDATVPTLLLDGIKASELNSRANLLKMHNENSLVLHAEDVLNAKVADLKAKFSGKDLIYIYHNQIDAKADNPKTEQETFIATATAIDEILNLIKRLRSGNISNIMITADHGYIYRQSELDVLDKIDLKQAEFVKKAPRYAISKEQFDQAGVKSISMADVLGNNDQHYVYYPLTGNIFNAPGAGKNYVHGGVSPQEMIVPLLNVHAIKGKDTATTVEVGLRPGNTRITGTSFSVGIIQKNAVSSALKGATFSVYFEDEDNQVISSKEIVDAFSREEKPENRIFNVRISIFDRNFDKRKKYYLVVENNENNQKVIREEHVMDIAITGGFGFDIGQ